MAFCRKLIIDDKFSNGLKKKLNEVSFVEVQFLKGLSFIKRRETGLKPVLLDWLTNGLL